jgi:membrane protease YdiL (CAAX protease family)
LALLVGKLYFGTDVDSRGYFYIIQSVSTFGTFLAPALLFSYCATKKWFSYNKADQVAPPPLVGYVILLSLFILPVIACLGYFNEQISLPESFQKIELWMREMEEKNLVLVQTLTANSNIPILLLNIMLVAFLPAFFEEFLFRGTIQPFLSKWFLNKKIAILVTAFIFSTIHFQFYGFIPRFLLGIYLGYLFVWSKSLWLPVIAHFMHNANSLIFDYAIQKRGIDMETIEPSKISGFYPTAIICTLLVAFGIFLLYKKSRQILL